MSIEEKMEKIRNVLKPVKERRVRWHLIFIWIYAFIALCFLYVVKWYVDGNAALSNENVDDENNDWLHRTESHQPQPRHGDNENDNENIPMQETGILIMFVVSTVPFSNQN
jgi:hypothetical protein